MRNTFKRLFSLFLSFVMAFGMLSEVSANQLQKYQSLSRSMVGSFVDEKGKVAFADNVIDEENKTTTESALGLSLEVGVLGTKTNPYSIGSREELEKISEKLDGYYKLVADIDLENEEWIPIGTYEKNFKGGLDGNGFKISNLKIKESSAEYVGLFGCTSESIFESVIIQNIDIATTGNVGALVAYARGGTINKCAVTGEGLIYAENENHSVGGIIGILQSSKINKSFSTIKTRGMQMVGNCVGQLKNSYMTDCFATGRVDGYNYTYTGGLSGYSYQSTIKDSYYAGQVSSKKGLAGYSPYSTIMNSYFDSTITDITTPEEQARTTNEMMSQSTFVDWDFVDTWGFDSRFIYPYLKENNIFPESYKGSVLNPYLIENKEQLKEISKDLYGCYKLIADIDLKSEEWIPIGTDKEVFVGRLDGNGFKISNLKIKESKSEHVGLFGYVNGAIFENVAIENVDITTDKNVGALASYVSNSVINKCAVTGEGLIYAEGANHSVGGIIGILQSSKINKSFSTIKTRGMQMVGNCVGQLKNSYMTDCFATGRVDGYNYTYTGGLSGYSYQSTIKDSYYAGQVSSKKGLAGYSPYSTVINSYFDSTIIDITTPIEQARTTDKMMSESTFIDWDFVDTWGFDSRTIYPYLKENNKFQGSYKGSISNPYLIKNKEQLKEINNDLYGCYKLIADIDLKSEEWIPIGTDKEVFVGRLDGNGFKISNLKIKESKAEHVGLFGYANGATFENVVIENVDITTDKNVGALASYVLNSVINKCAVTGEGLIHLESGDKSIGGIIGTLESSKINKSFSTIKIIGMQMSGNCVGQLKNSYMTDCFATGRVDGYNYTYTGGISGYSYQSTIKNCYYAGQVSSKKGLAGYSAYSTVINSYFDSTISNITTPTEQARTTAEMMSKSNFEGWNFSDTWGINESTSYPYLMKKSGTEPETDKTNPISKPGYNKTTIVGSETEFDGSQSSDDNEITSYDWDFGDGKTATGLKVKHTYENAGEYKVTLKVKDRAGNEDSKSITVQVFEQSQTGTIIIKVIDQETKTPIPNASVYIDFPDNPSLVVTDANGTVNIVGEPGNYNFSAYKKNYLPKEQNEKITQYETTNATIAIEKSEVAVGEIVTRPLSIDEIKDLGIDTTAPENQHIYSYTVTLEFGKETIEMPKIIVNGTTGSSIGSGSWDLPSLPSNFKGSVYPNIIPVPDHPEIPPTLLILKISSAVSFLKEFFEVAVIMQNMADYQFIMKDSKVTLELPEGLSLADTGFPQEFEQNLGDIAGGQVEFASWIVRGDKVGDYDLSADFKAMLMPFKAPVSATFKTANPLKVKGAEGLKIYVSPEPVAHPGEPYYVKFTLANESEREFYNVKTSFNTEDGITPTPRKRTIMTDQGSIELNQSYFNYLLDYIEDQKNLPILEDGDSFEIKVLKPHESLSGTYTAILDDGDDPEKVIYKLTKAFSQTNEGSTVEIPVVFSETPLHVSGNPNDAPIKWDFDSNGIDLATGANIVDVSTVNVFGVKDIPFKLKNNSMDLEKGRFGQGWSSNYDLNVKPQEDGSLLVYTSNTSYIRFVNDNAKKGIVNGNIKDSSIKINNTGLLGTYSCLTTNYQRYKLTKEADGYFVTDDKGNIYYFDKEGKLNQTKDKKGRTLEVSSEDKKITIKEKSTNKQIQTTSNDEGYITKIADNAGKESTLTYNEAGQIETITNAVGDKTRYEYDPEGRLIRQMINNSDVMTIKYDELGRVVSKTDAMGESITYSYDTKSEFWRTLISITDRNGNTEKIKADWRGHIVANKNALEEETYFTYNRYGDMTSVRDALGNSSIYEYDKDGNLLKTEDAEGILETMTYDNRGNMLTHEMQNGSKTINTYNDTNLLTSTTDERGVTETFKYNEDGQVITKTVEGLGTSHYTYSGGKLATETDFLGNITKYEYDSTGNLIKSTDPEGNITSYKYDATNRLIESTTADNATTGFKYDDRDNIVEIIDPLKKVTKQTFDPNNRLIKVIDTMSQTTEYEYDKERNLIKGTNPNGGVFTYVYDKVYRQIETEDAETSKVGYTYDKVGRLKTKTLYNDEKDAKYSYEYYRNGSLKSETDPLGNTTKYNYNNVGQLAEVTNAKGKKTWYEYDNSNNLLWIKDAENNKTSYEYDKFGRQTASIDPKGNKTKLEYNEANLVKSNIDALNNKTQNTYDKNGNVIKTIDTLGHENKISYDKVSRVKSVTNALGNTVSTEYDLYGNVISVIDSYGVKSVETKYNALGSPIESKDALGNTNKAEYNEMQEVITKIDALNESNKYIYNKVGKLLKTTDPEEGVTSFTYDKLGNMLTFTDAMGSKTEIEYDLSGNLTKQKMAAGGEKLYAYDELNRIKTFTNGRGQELVYKYTDSNRLENGAGIEYTYDKNGNILTVKDENGTTTRTYDELNRVTSFTDVNGNKIGYVFDAVGNLKELHYPTGEVVYYKYDEANQLKEVKDYEGRITKYDYNKNGQLIKTERPDGSVESITYDAIGRMTEKKDIGGVLGTGNGNNTGKRIVLNHYTYEYNGLGNIVKENDLSDDEKVSKEYAYENTNNLQAFTNMTYGKGNQLVSYNGKEVKYDSDGNMISGPLKGSFVNYEYDKFNRLVKVGSTEYKYDGENTRISKETKAGDNSNTNQNNSNTNNNDNTKVGKTTYITDPNASISRLLISINPDGSKVIYVYGLGLISQEHATATTVQSPNSTKTYSLFHYDYRGSTTVITNQKSEITDVITYDAYGGISGRKGNTDTLFLYVGQQGVQTDDNGLYYMRGRYYNTDIHRFINEDPIKDGLNWYAYVNGNPVMNTDSSGKSPVTAWTSGMWWLPLSDSPLLPFGDAIYIIGILVTGVVTVLAMDNVAEQLGKISKKHADIADGRCENAAEEMKQYLIKKKIKAGLITIIFSEGGYVGSEIYPKKYVGNNGYHKGIIYKGIVFCTIHPYGLPVDLWYNDFYGHGSKDKTIVYF